jgi:hypothetical protein
MNHSWTKTNILKLKNLEELPYFYLVEHLHNWLIAIYLLIINLPQTLNRLNLFTHYSYDLQLEANSLERPLRWGAGFGFFYALGFAGTFVSLSKKHKLKLLKYWPKFIDQDNVLIALLYALKAPQSLPKKFEHVLASIFGLIGLIVLPIGLMFWQWPNGMIGVYSWLLLGSTLIYAAMRSSVMIVNRWSLVHAGLLYLSVQQLPKLLITLGLNPELVNSSRSYISLIFFLAYPLLVKAINKDNSIIR